MSGDFKSKLVILLLGGQYPIDEEIGGFEVIGFDGQLLDGIPSGLIASIHVNRTSAFWDFPTCSGELELLVLAITMDVR